MLQGTPMIRRASGAEVAEDLARNPTDLWFTRRLELPRQRVSPAAIRLSGCPMPGPDGTEVLWRLRVGEGDGLPVYLSVGPDGPHVLFSATQTHPRPEAVVAAIHGLLLRVEGDG